MIPVAWSRVVDESGVLKAFSRMDGVGVATPIVVQNKAFTAAVYRTSSQAFADRFKDEWSSQYATMLQKLEQAMGDLATEVQRRREQLQQIGG